MSLALSGDGDQAMFVLNTLAQPAAPRWQEQSLGTSHRIIRGPMALNYPLLHTLDLSGDMLELTRGTFNDVLLLLCYVLEFWRRTRPITKVILRSFTCMTRDIVGRLRRRVPELF